MKLDSKFWKSKKVLITGNTGFKGLWLTRLLLYLNSEVIGFSLMDSNSAFVNKKIINNSKFTQIYGDVRDIKSLRKTILKFKPKIIFHLAAQSLVFESYVNPVDTFSINAIGTLNVLDLTKNFSFVNSSIIITSDKCYDPNKNKKYFDEKSSLGGNDPYSASKAVSEIISHSYIKSFPSLNVATVRAGNVIGGGDWNEKRLLPDLMKAIYKKKELRIRNLSAIRPWQHVLEPLTGYLLLTQKLFSEKNKEKSIYRSGWNFGPSIKNHKNVLTIIGILQKKIEKKLAFEKEKNKFHEEKTIFLNSSKSKKILKWQGILNINDSIDLTLKWYNDFYLKKRPLNDIFNLQIKEYLQRLNEYKKN